MQKVNACSLRVLYKRLQAAGGTQRVLTNSGDRRRRVRLRGGGGGCGGGGGGGAGAGAGGAGGGRGGQLIRQRRYSIHTEHQLQN